MNEEHLMHVLSLALAMDCDDSDEEELADNIYFYRRWTRLLMICTRTSARSV